MADLGDYRGKRDFSKTGEPVGTDQASSGKYRFVVQKHAARRLHYDLRLEMDGVLRSWAVPRGPSLNPEVKRLAVHTEDHPMEYLDFEGVIPKGQYGAGRMIVWDQGTYRCVGKYSDPVQAWDRGMVDLELSGEKLGGLWVLVKIHDSQKDWLLIKKNDAFADATRDLLSEEPESVLSGLSVEELVEGGQPHRRRKYQRLLEELQLAPSSLRDVPPPMLPTLVGSVPSGAGWVFELKYDGYRALAEKKTAKSAFFPET